MPSVAVDPSELSATPPASRTAVDAGELSATPPDPIHVKPERAEDLPSQQDFDQAHQSAIQRFRAYFQPAVDAVSKPVADLTGKIRAVSEIPIAPLLQNVLRPPTQYDEPAPTTTAGKIAQGVGAGATKVAEGLTTPENLALLAGTGGVEMIPKIGAYLPRAVSAVFGASMLKNAYDKIPEVKAAIDKGDAKAAAQAITEGVASGALSVAAGAHAAGVGESVSRETPAVDKTKPGAVDTAAASAQAGMDALNQGRTAVDPSELSAKPPVRSRAVDATELSAEPPLRLAVDASELSPEPPQSEALAAAPPTPEPVSKPLWEMSHDDLAGAEQEAKTRDQSDLTDLFGADGAQRYKRLERVANSTTRGHQETSQASDEIDRMESALPEADRNRLYGIGDIRPQLDDIRQYRQALGRLDWTSPQALGDSLKWAVTDIGDKENPADMTPDERVRYAQLRYGMSEAQKLGWDPVEVSEAALRGAAGRFDPGDVGFMLRRFARPGAEIPSERPAIGSAQPDSQSLGFEPEKDPLAGRVEQIPTDQIRVDPARFQFKSNVGHGGAGEELRSVQTYDPEKSGVLSVWRDPADGETYVVNGHNRLALADRTGTPSVTGRYLDAKDATEARTKGALINIAEGRGDAVDAAKVFRDGGYDAAALEREGISLKGEKARQGLALANLDPHLFSKVVSGELPVERAAVIGEGLDNPNDQRALYDLVQASEKGGKRLANGQVGEMIRLANGDTAKTTETQESLFGSEDVTRSLIKEKAEVSDYVRTRLGQERRLFAAVGNESAAARLSDTGNVIRAGENAQAAERTGQAQALYDKLSTSAGDVSNSLNAAARQIADGASPNAVKERTYGEIKRSLLEQAKNLTGAREVHAERPQGDASSGPGKTSAGKHDLFGVGAEPPSAEAGEPQNPVIKNILDQRTAAEKVEAIKANAKIRERGAIDPSLLALGTDKFIERDVAPAARSVAAALSEAGDQALRLVAPDLRSDSAELTGLTLRVRMAQFARRYDQARSRLRDAWKFFDGRTADQNYSFMDDVERGLGRGSAGAPENAALEPIARTLARSLDQRRREVQALGEGALERFYVNYFPHLFEKPEAIPQFVSKFFGDKANMEGAKSFLKRREFPTMKEARAAGLKPISDNPIELVLAKIREMDRYLLAHATLRDLAERGIAKRVSGSEADTGQMDLLEGAPLKKDWLVPTREDLPPGYVSIHDPIGGGKWFADEGAAQVLNNYLAPGLRSKSGAYRLAIGINNSMNQANLGLSAFHITGEMLRSAMNRNALGLKDVFQGQPVRGSVRIVTAPAGPFIDYLQGAKGVREWFKPGSEGAPIAAMIDGLMKGGARANVEQDYINGAAASMMREAKAGNFPGALARAIPAFFETTAKPMMQQLIPRIKLGAAMQMAEQELGRLPADADVDQTRRAMAKVWDSVDNRMGQMVYDNLFWNRTMKDIAHLGIRAVGWDLGTLREFGGGVKDAAGLLRGKTPATYDRIAYTISAAMTTALIGAVYQYAHTGKGPEQVKDYFFPKREDGSRISMPTDIKDVYHYLTAPVRTLENKASPLANTTLELLHNRDFYDRPIREEGDPLYRQGQEVLHFLYRQTMPFPLQGQMGKQKFTETNPEHKVENFLGITRASGDIQDNQKPRRGPKSPY